MHASSIKGLVGMNFGQAEREGFQKVITPSSAVILENATVRSTRLYPAFLFSILVLAKSECRTQALPSSNPVISRLMGYEVSVHRTNWDMDHPSAAAFSSQASTSLSPGTMATLTSELGALLPCFLHAHPSPTVCSWFSSTLPTQISSTLPAQISSSLSSP